MSAPIMHKREFVPGMAVRPIGSMHVMTLGGTPDEWICSWYDNDEHRAMRYMPEDLEPVCMLVGDMLDRDADGQLDTDGPSGESGWARIVYPDVELLRLDED